VPIPPDVTALTGITGGQNGAIAHKAGFHYVVAVAARHFGGLLRLLVPFSEIAVFKPTLVAVWV
jgi:hypothetical protein